VSPVASAVTGPDGSFKVVNVPDGTNVPLVVQLGKWRMLHTITTVKSCQDNPQPDKALRLPRNHTEGDLPNIAISTGAADTLECLPLRMGVDPKEYVGGAGGAGRVHVFQGSATVGVSPNTVPPGPPSSTGLWSTRAQIAPFDLVVLSCEGVETMGMNQQVMLDYVQAGGRVFASHFHYAWFNTGPFTMSPAPLATWTPGSNTTLGILPTVIETTLMGGAAFPQGQAFYQWLLATHAIAPGDGGGPAELLINNARHNANLAAANSLSTGWIAPAPTAGQTAGAVQAFSFDTPLGGAAGSQCGRVVYSDMHVTGGAGVVIGGMADYPGTAAPVVPTGCAMRPLTSQESAIEFLLFNLSSCLTPVGDAPMAP
jgi:hypothetical protein